MPVEHWTETQKHDIYLFLFVLNCIETHKNKQKGFFMLMSVPDRNPTQTVNSFLRLEIHTLMLCMFREE